MTSRVNIRRTKKTRQQNPSSRSIQLLKQLWQTICNYIDAQQQTASIELSPADVSAIRTASMYSHIPEQIRHIFESASHHRGIKTEIELKRGRKVAIYIADPSSEFTDHYIRNSLTNIIAWLNYVSDISDDASDIPICAQQLNIYLLLTSAKKELPRNKAELIDEIHANTAFTTACSPSNDIYIYRREEWFKVFMHETFHCFGLDFSSSIGDDSTKRILSMFPALDKNTDVRLYETFCEMWAEIFHLCFCLFVSKDGKCRRFSERTFREALHKEQVFSIIQSNKLLHRSGIKYGDLVENNAKIYSENTPAFSYYVIKSMMLWNIDAFLNWCVANNKTPIKFDQMNIAKYCDFVESLSKDVGYKRVVERMRNPLRTTLRMTAIDPKWN